MSPSLQWVTEWRIEKDDFWKYKVTNGGVYTPQDTLQEAEQCLIENIKREQRQFRINQLRCPHCNKRFAEHEGIIDYRNCLLGLALDGYVRR